jgi:hypothetical protein
MNARTLVEYLAGLAENNNRAWFVMTKPSYDILRAEFTELVAQVIDGAAKFDPAVRPIRRRRSSGSTGTCGSRRTRVPTRRTSRP